MTPRRRFALAQELPYDLSHVQGVGRTLAAFALLLDPADDARVETEAGAEGEPALRDALVLGPRCARGQPQADGALGAVAQRVQQGAGRLHDVIGQPQRAGEDIGGAAGDDGQPGMGVRIGAACQQAVDDLVDRAVAAERHHQVDLPALGGLPGEITGVPAVLRLRDLQLEVAGERVGEYLTGAGTGGGCCRIDHEECAHMEQRTYLPVPAMRPIRLRGHPGGRGAGATLLG